MEMGGVRVSIIVAVDLLNHIGNSKSATGLPWPWHRKDMKRFREITIPKPVIMGRKTYALIKPEYRPLSDRVNIVISKTADYAGEGAMMVDSPSSGLALAVAFANEKGGNEVIVAGGEQIYRYFLERNQVDRIYLTQIKGRFEADAKFPLDPASASNWKLDGVPVHVDQDAQNPFPMIFSTLNFKPR